MTLDHYGLAPIVMPALHRTALDKIEWPDIRPQGEQ